MPCDCPHHPTGCYGHPLACACVGDTLAVKISANDAAALDWIYGRLTGKWPTGEEPIVLEAAIAALQKIIAACDVARARKST